MPVSAFLVRGDCWLTRGLSVGIGGLEVERIWV